MRFCQAIIVSLLVNSFRFKIWSARLLSAYPIPRQYCGAIFDDYLTRAAVEVRREHAIDNLGMAMSLVASTRGFTLLRGMRGVGARRAVEVRLGVASASR